MCAIFDAYIEIEKIVYIEEEKTIKIGYDAKSVRLDVYVKGDEKIYNLEMQVINYKNLPKRSRYYQSMIDLNSLEKGHNYKELPESYVIFICTFDPFKEGLPRYLFENVCRQKRELMLTSHLSHTQSLFDRKKSNINTENTTIFTCKIVVFLL